jgi:hypothetical protein
LTRAVTLAMKLRLTSLVKSNLETSRNAPPGCADTEAVPRRISRPRDVTYIGAVKTGI